jgi:glycerol-3-phosphate cytidylyltransferase-like family protein
MSYKTVLFNSLMMALKQKIAFMESRWQSARVAQARVARRRQTTWLPDGEWREKVSLAKGREMPWEAATRGAVVAYADGSWSFLHAAQVHILRESARRGDHLIVGVHSDESHFAAVDTYPVECCAQRVARLRSHGLVSSILEDAPWDISEDLVAQLGIGKVISGTITKKEDCMQPASSPLRRPAGDAEGSATGSDHLQELAQRDPYAVAKRLGIFEEVQSLNQSTEHDVFVKRLTNVLFSNVDASIDWRILASASPKSPGRRARSRSPNKLGQNGQKTKAAG